MKTLNYSGIVLYFHDFMTDDEGTQMEIRIIQREFDKGGIIIKNITETDMPPFGEKYYDILLFDWGGASMGNSLMHSFCEQILNEAIECPSKIYIMTSAFTKEAMKEAQKSFEQANGEIPFNVFLTIREASDYIKKLN